MTNEETFKEMLDRMKAECESCQYYYHCTYDRRMGFPFAIPNPMFYSFEERQKVYEYQEEANKKPCVSYLSKNMVAEALEKQIPMKIIDDKCPTCNSPILYSNGVHNNYCYVCGQRLE